MVRPRKERWVAYNSGVSYFKPRGIPMLELAEVRLTIDEREAIRLADLLGMSHEEAGRQMGVSRATFGRIIQRARNTIANALISGKAIKVEGGNYRIISGPRIFKCTRCGHIWKETKGSGRPEACPECEKDKFYRIPVIEDK